MAPGILTAAILTPVAIEHGGYYPPAWGLIAAVFLGVAAAAILLRPGIELRRPAIVTLGGLGFLSLWMVASTTWSTTPTAAGLEAERAATYVTGLAAVLLISRRGSIGSILAGTLFAATAAAADGLAGRILPSLHAAQGIATTGRMSQPLGYWNAVGILVVMACLIAIGFAANASTLTRRALGAITLPVLVTSLYFTFSRGSWAALAFGLAGMVALSTTRWRLLLAVAATAPWVAFDVLVAATSPALVHVGSSVGAATAPGHRLGIALGGSALGIVCMLAVCRPVEARWQPPEWAARASAWMLAAAACVAVVGVLVTIGSPGTIFDRVSDAFSGRASHRFEPTKQHPGQSLNVRLLSLSGNSRADLWRIAWEDTRDHPLLGSGAGSYGAYYLQHRTSGVATVNANNLYLEILADLGPLGLAALLAGLVPPIVAATRRRAAVYAPAAFGAYVAFLLHASVDWDWQMPAVTLSALLCGAALLLTGHRDVANWQPSRPARAVAVGAATVLAVVSLALLRGNLAISQSQHAASHYKWRSARASAQIAVKWEPWSADAWMALGEAWIGLNRPAKAAKAFRTAVRRDPGEWQTWYDLSIAVGGREGTHALAESFRLDPQGPEPNQVTY